MPIRVKCQCGRTLKSPEEFAGKWARCPKCKVAVQIPLAEAPTLVRPAGDAVTPKTPRTFSDEPTLLHPSERTPSPSPDDPKTARQGAASSITLKSAEPLLQIGNYKIVEEIARGGMGIVFKVQHVSTGKVCALKMILSGEFAGNRDKQRFRVEAESAKSLTHSNIIRIHEVGDHQGRPYFTMDYINGRPLSRQQDSGAIDIDRAVRLVRQIALAIDYAHSKGIVHRDLTPANVLVDEHDNVRLMDFGLAKRMHGEKSITRTGDILGTPGYMAPEQAIGKSKTVGPKADIYSAGAILYWCLVGRPPFKGSTPVETLIQVINEQPQSPRTLRPEVAEDLEHICLKCLAKDPKDRYVTARELADDLQRYIQGMPVRARPIVGLDDLNQLADTGPIVTGVLSGSDSRLVVGWNARMAYRVRRWKWRLSDPVFVGTWLIVFALIVTASILLAMLL